MSPSCNRVVSGKVVGADVKSRLPMTVEGLGVCLADSSEGVAVNDAEFITTDVMATNGVIHVIDTVVLPN